MKRQKAFWFFFLFWVFFLLNSSFAYKELLIEKRGGRPIRVIKVVLDGEHFVVASPASDGGATTEELARKVWGDTAINAAFFVLMIIRVVKLMGKGWRILFQKEYLWEMGKIGVDSGEIPVLGWFFLLISKGILFLFRKILESRMLDFGVIPIRIN